jgi:hypothetical protein
MLEAQAVGDVRLTTDRETSRMQDLRLIGVHEDGVHLLLADDDGNRFRVPLDESLRAAVRRDRPRLGQLQIEIEGGLRPKDVQSMIRAGLTAEEVADRAGWTVEKVHRYETPIVAEREHVAGLARQVRLRARSGGQAGAPTLGARVAERLRSRELDPDTARWDSRRTERGLWTVVLFFNAGGRQREALWDFDPLARTVVARDDEARWLSEDEDSQASPGPIPAPHLAPTRPTRVYDVEAEGGIDPASARRREGEPVDLVEAMRERSSQRGRRRRGRGADVPGLESTPDDALPLEELTRRPDRDDVPPPAHVHPEDDARATRAGGPAAGRSRRRPAGRTTSPASPTLDVGRDPGHGEVDPGDDRAQVAGSGRRRSSESTQPLPQSQRRRAGTTGPPRAQGTAAPRDVDATASTAATDEPLVDDRDEVDDPPADEVTASRPKPNQAARPSPRRSGRPSVPSWDDIMFGRKGE